jgi:hypothetical protein
MPEVQEVFRMATQKVGPDRGFLERQNQRQRRRARNRKVGPLVLVAAIVAGLVTFAVIQNSGTGSTPITSTTPSPTALPQEGFPTRYVDVRTGETTPGPVIAEGDNEGYTVSADGTTIAYWGADDRVYVGDLDGASVSNLRSLENPISTEKLGGWDLSPDGSKIVYQVKPTSGQDEGDLYIADVGTGRTTRITHLEQLSSAVYAMGPTFSPDGKTVLFNAPRISDTGQQTWNLYTVPVDGGEPKLVRPNAILGSYSPDGTMIAFETPGAAVNSDLFVATADGRNVRRLVKGQLGWWSQWSPNGTRIAYTDYATGDVLYVVDVASGETTKVGIYAPAFWVDDHTMITDTP